MKTYRIEGYQAYGTRDPSAYIVQVSYRGRVLREFSGERAAEQALSDAAIAGMSIDQLNAGLQSYRADLRYTRADAEAAAQIWNRAKTSTLATIVTMGGFPHIIIVEVTQ